MAGSARVPYDLCPGRLVDHLDAQLLGLLEFRARARSSDHEVSLGADRARGSRAERLGLGLGLVAAHRLKLAGEDYRLAGNRARLGLDDVAGRRDFAKEIVPDLDVVRLVEEIAK